MASRGEKINWCTLVDTNATYQIRAHVKSDEYESPIAPFLTQYIGHFLDYHRVNHSPWPMGIFFEVQREIAMAARSNSTLPNPGKRPRIEVVGTADGGNGEGTSTYAATNWSPRAKEFDAQRRTMATCLEEMFNFLHLAEQQQLTVSTKHKEWEAQSKRQAAQAVQNALNATRKHAKELRQESQLQQERLQGTITSLQNQLNKRDLELQAATEKYRNLEDQNVRDRHRIQRLEMQTSELLLKCKALTDDNANTSTAPPSQSMDLEAMQRLRREIEDAKENFKANKVAWTHHAAKEIPTTAYQLLLTTPPTTDSPPTPFLDQCMGDGLLALELEFSDNNWGSQGEAFMGDEEEFEETQP